MKDNIFTVSFPELGIDIKAEHGDNLLSLIQIADIPIAADCSGVGKCGKCVVLINGEKKLACKTHITFDCDVIVPEKNNADFEILTDHKIDYAEDISPNKNGESGRYIIAIDIGTTTVVVKLLQSSDASEVASAAFLNPQIKYGADVISRINASMDDSELLSSLIREKLDSSIAKIIADNSIAPANIDSLVIAGNTAMSYILLGLPCRSLGIAPFIPQFKIKDKYEYKEIFKSETLSCSCLVLPFLSSYVGGDITAGLLSLDSKDNYILIDMGTNGELAFRHNNKLICTSTAAGPAFEGVNISCGMGSTEGAISKIWIADGEFKFETVGAAAPKGICGSGILDLMACLVREEIIDETGAFEDDSEFVTDEGIIIAKNEATGEDIVFKQKDVREFQLAKSAVRSGLEILIQEMNEGIPDIVYLAGGFGQKMNPESAFEIGLLPPSVKGKVSMAGNTSLAGAIKVALRPELYNGATILTEINEEINLASHKDFNDMFMDYLAFE